MDELPTLALGDGLSYIEDASGQLTLEDIMKREDWQTSHDKVFSKGYRASAWWFRVDLTRHSQADDWMLDVSYPLLDHVDVYVVRRGVVEQQYKLGDAYPFAHRTIMHRNFLAPLHLPQDEPVRLFIRAQTSGSANVPMAIWQKKQFDVIDAAKSTGQGMYFGALLIIAAYNLLMYLALGERVYLLYVGYVISTGMVVASLDGWAFQYFWPVTSFLNDYGTFYSIILACVFGMGFTSIFLGIPSLSKALHRAFSLMMVLAAALAASMFVLPYSTMIRYAVPFAGLCCTLGMFCGIYALARRLPAAKYYSLAWVMVLTGGVALALCNIGLLPVNRFTANAMQVGSLMEVLLLSFALAERINQERALRLTAQQDAFALQVKANAELEGRVKERTIELEEAYRKLQELSNTDQLTGIRNRRCLDEYLKLEFERAARHQHPVAVMLIDVDHFKSVNDTHGHLVGDDCLKEIAARAAAQACRPSDLAARYGGEEFCVVLPETDAAGAIIVAERIRRGIEATPISTRAGALRITASLGVCAKVPAPEADPATFLEQADASLYRSKEGGRNRVTVAG